MSVENRDRAYLRDLARRYLELCESERNLGLMAEWRRLNNLEPCRPMVYANDGLLQPEIMAKMPPRRVADDELRGAEQRLQWTLHWGATVGDDRVFEPWFGMHAAMFRHPEGVWGVAPNRVGDATSRGWRCLPVLRTMEDLARLKTTEHRVLDPEPPRVRKVRDVFGDLLPVHVSRHTVYGVWGGTDLCQQAGQLFGLEELMMALYTDPGMVHAFMAFTRDGVLANLEQGEAAGDWSTTSSWYYKTPACCDQLPDPQPRTYGARLKDLAWFSHAQEFESVSPAMYDEFLFAYQLPIMERFGRITYGCCDTLDTKLDVLRRLPNLTKVVSGPRSDPARYPETFGDRCVVSWRPVPSIVAAERFDEEAQRRQLREGLAKLRGCNVEIFMHEPMTVRGDLERVRTWVRIARDEAERAATA